tara:strand:- start:69 stop:611 length:543 start_codon:yes stop_codon:yes gene_type:complete
MAKLKIDNIGILGGSFDPAHEGHLAISKIAIKKLKLKKIYWVITKKNPLKKNPLFSLKRRLLLAKKIVENVGKIRVLYLDDILKSSRTINAIKYIFQKDKPKNLYLIIGSDILLEFHKWKSWKKIVKLTKLIVFSRKGYDRKSKESIVVKYLNKNRIIFIRNKHFDISSTALKKSLKSNY